MNTAPIPQFAPAACSDPRPAPELCLLAAVVQMALRDLKTRQHKEEAQAFIESPDLDWFCEWLGWNVDTLRVGAAEEAAILPRWYV